MASRKRGQKPRKSRPAPNVGAPPNPAEKAPPSSWSKSRKWAAGILATALAGALATLLLNVFHDLGSAASHLLPKKSAVHSPVFVAVRREAGFSGGCGQWIVTRSLKNLMPPSPAGASPQWVEQSGAIDASVYNYSLRTPNGASNIDVTVQGRTAAPVILTGIQFVPVRRSTSQIRGAAITVQCGGPMEAAGIDVNLNDNPVKIVNSFREMVPKMPAGQPQWLLKPLRFPYQVTNRDGEVFKIIAYSRSYCAWYAILYWSVNGRNGQSVINDNGKPFQTAPADQAMAGYGYKNRHWYACKLDSPTCSVQYPSQAQAG